MRERIDATSILARDLWRLRLEVEDIVDAGAAWIDKFPRACMALVIEIEAGGSKLVILLDSELNPISHELYPPRS